MQQHCDRCLCTGRFFVGIERRITPIAMVLVLALAAYPAGLCAMSNPSASPASPPATHSSSPHVSPASLSFPAITVGTTSTLQYPKVTNSGSSALNFGNITISGPFAFGGMGSCETTLAPGASCTLSVEFWPTAAGAAAGAVTITDNFGTQTLPLSGSGIADSSAAGVSVPPASASSPSGVSLSPASLSFGARTVGTTSDLQPFKVTNSGSSALNFSNITMSGPFAFGGGCKISLAPGTSCTLRVQFMPTAVGAASGAVTLTDNAGTQTLLLSGSGIALSKGSPTSNGSSGN